VPRRAAAAAGVLAGMRVLWVDDEPGNNASEVYLLNSLGIYVNQVTSTDAALNQLKREKYEAVVSDVARGSEPDAGIRMVAEMWERHLYRWKVFYVGRLDLSKGAPPHAFGITNRPDHLLHF
jgi:DNA-binding NtrC family response regulator